jgi:hypothetical protein
MKFSGKTTIYNMRKMMYYYRSIENTGNVFWDLYCPRLIEGKMRVMDDTFYRLFPKIVEYIKDPPSFSGILVYLKKKCIPASWLANVSYEYWNFRTILMFNPSFPVEEINL